MREKENEKNERRRNTAVRFRTLSLYETVSSFATHVMRKPAHTRLVKKIIRKFLPQHCSNDLTRKMGITKLLMQRSGLRLLACNVRFQCRLLLRFFFKLIVEF